ncbi:unnamed protein product [Eruca vesicaria subsp. sativa]|uniref:Peptidylprolyl isomerase n=1 Tax=Eruca vesicaria subsp. sativa TaxID=29727 RepID=A0ABC8KUZ6_ERUVS|nr:unnamed protein product [Eruca vesicaria subsp. sativa]
MVFGMAEIYDHQFPDEDCIRKHDRPGVLSMGNSECPDYDAFGQVVSGFDVISPVEQMVGNQFGNPSEPVIIADCGQILP